jgi:hypothetical protein
MCSAFRFALLAMVLTAVPSLAQKDPPPPLKGDPPAKVEPKLKIGDPAPPLSITKWHQGPEVKAFEKGKVYVVVFWDTQGINGLSRLQTVQALHAKHKDVIPVAVGVGKEKAKPGDPSAEDEAAYLKEAKAKYTFGFADDSAGATRKAYGDRKYTDGDVFVVGKDGTIAYFSGFAPDRHLGEVVAKVLAGTWQGQKDADTLEAVGREIFKVMSFREKLNDLQSGLKGATREKAQEAVAKLAGESQTALAEVLKKYPEYASEPRVLAYQLDLAVRAGDQAAAEKFLAALLKPGVDLSTLDVFGNWMNDVARDVMYDSLHPKITPGKLAGPVADAILKADFINDWTGEYLMQIGQFAAIMGAPVKGKELIRKMVDVSTRLPADQRKTVLAQLETQIDELVKQVEAEKKKPKK